MKILVAIANYGTRNMRYLETLIDEYQSMAFDIDIVVFSNIPKSLPHDIECVVGLPTKDPRSLPYGHKQLFVARADDYDLFIYTEDDTLISERHIRAFCTATEVLPGEQIAGFIRYELDTEGKKYYSTIHSRFHWDAKSVTSIGEYTFAHFTNDHSACYLLTREQLRKVIDTGNYLKGPREERYGILETAATDPYTQCGFRKTICISHIEDFSLHHLPDAYLGKMGLEDSHLALQIEALMTIKEGRKTDEQLFNTRTRLSHPGWDKKYYDLHRDDILALIPDHVDSFLSVGCGWGSTETALVEKGKHVTAVPLDSVIGASLEAKGIHVMQPHFEKALQELHGKLFGCIMFLEVLQHLPEPETILSNYCTLLQRNGYVVVSVPYSRSLALYKKALAQKSLCNDIKKIGSFEESRLHSLTPRIVKKWLRKSGLKATHLNHTIPQSCQTLSTLSRGLLDRVLSSSFVVVGEKQDD